MKVDKIVLILALLVSVIGAFAEIPYAGLALVLLGLVKGVTGVGDDDRMMFMVTAIALSMVTGALGDVPTVGSYITAILTGVSAFLNAGVVAVIVKMIVGKVTS